jgi:hypothetical protein
MQNLDKNIFLQLKNILKMQHVFSRRETGRETPFTKCNMYE